MANSVERREHRIVIIHLFLLEQAIENFKQDMGRFPSTQEGFSVLIHQPRNSQKWKGPYIKPEELDQWGRADNWGTKYRYLYPAKYGNLPYDLYSFGKNKQDEFGQGDDITNWKGINLDYYDDFESVPDRKVIIITVLIFSIILGGGVLYFFRLLR